MELFIRRWKCTEVGGVLGCHRQGPLASGAHGPRVDSHLCPLLNSWKSLMDQVGLPQRLVHLFTLESREVEVGFWVSVWADKAV